MTSALEKLDRNYELVKSKKGVTDTHFYIGEIKECTPEQFAEEVNIVLDAYISGKVSPLCFGDAQR